MSLPNCICCVGDHQIVCNGMPTMGDCRHMRIKAAWGWGQQIGQLACKFQFAGYRLVTHQEAQERQHLGGCYPRKFADKEQ